MDMDLGRLNQVSNHRSRSISHSLESGLVVFLLSSHPWHQRALESFSKVNRK